MFDTASLLFLKSERELPGVPTAKLALHGGSDILTGEAQLEKRKLGGFGFVDSNENM
jgi:hypothetical protein